MDKLIKNIRKKNFHLAVLGTGYVGLPTAALFADVGFPVVTIDVKPRIIKILNTGVSPINEPGLQELVARNIQMGKLKATLNSGKALPETDGIIIAVQTPTDQNKNPNISFLMKAVEEVGNILKERMLVIISSTIPPGTMLGKVQPKLESLSNLKTDIDFYLAYSPERIAPGKTLKEFVESPRLVGGIGPRSTKIAAELFSTVCKTTLQTDVSTAEIIKLSENTFRDVNIAFANQLALICEQHGVDAKKTIDLANTHPRVNIHKPGPGVGGPCLPKDPYLLTHNVKIAKPNLIEVSRQMNDYMPTHVTKMTLQALKSINRNIKGIKITILGTAYKADVDDSRRSPSEPIIQQLLDLGAKIITYDPYCSESFSAKKSKDLKEAIKGSSCVIFITDHKEFKKINLMKLRRAMNDKPIIVDCRRLFEPAEAKKAGFRYFGVGYGVKDNL